MQRFVLLLLLILATGCTIGPEPDATSVSAGSPLPLTVVRDMLPVTMADLAAAPNNYENRFIRLTGQFRPLPTLVCALDPHPLPAGWSLVADGFQAYARGFSQIRSLLPAGLTVTVVGQWQRWEGPVGCGKEAVYQELWFLRVTQIESPAALARVTLTPGDNLDQLLARVATPIAGGEPASTATPSGPEQPTLPPVTETQPPPTPAPTVVELTPTTAVSVTGTAPAEPGNGTVTATATPEPGGTEEQQTAVPTTPATTGTPGTPTTVTATPTADPLTITPTATQPSGATAVPTGTPSPVIMGALESQFLAVERLEAGSVHVWDLEIEANDVLTAYVLSPNQDMVLALRDPEKNLITSQNDTPAGQVETLTQNLSRAGAYTLEISSVNLVNAEYALMILQRGSYQFIFRGALTYGNSRDGSLLADQDHFWQFQGSADDEITVTVSPNASSDTFIRFYGPDAELIDGYDFVDEGSTGEPETFTYVLPEAGIYSLHVGEYDFQPMTYSISVEN